MIDLDPIVQESGEGVQWRQVERVIDGDTIVVDGGERVRLIGVDAPDSVHPEKPVEPFGREASAFTRRMVEGRRVGLEYEPYGRKDRDGLTLAYVYTEDGELLNLEIIRRGYGHAQTRSPFVRILEFRTVEQEAREARRGLWADAELPADPASRVCP